MSTSFFSPNPTKFDYKKFCVVVQQFLKFGRLETGGFDFFGETYGRLTLEHGADRRETLGKRVSDDSPHSMFGVVWFGRAGA